MLSYQHGFHAGNRADVLKHAVLDTLLAEIVSVGKPTLYVETHAARGLYDLTGAQAEKTSEAKDGVLALLDGKVPRPLRPWMGRVSAAGPQAYPGSPLLAASHLGPRDRMVLFEKHPTEFAELNKTLGKDERVQIKQADGYSGALKLMPRGGEQMVVFVDPSYETERDMDALGEWAPRALKRWPNAVVILWLPLFRDEREADFGAYLSELEDGIIAGARWPVDPLDETALVGSAMVAYRAPEAARDTCAAIAAACQSYWSDSAPIFL